MKMLMILILMGVLCAIVLFLYLQLRIEIRSVRDQLIYTKKEGSSFTLFSTSSNKVMKDIIENINGIKDEMLLEKRNHLKNEKDIRDMIANISHDIRTPLTSIQGYLEMMRTSNDSVEKDRYYSIVEHRLKDLEAILDEFFLYTKLMNTSEEYTLETKEVYPLICGSLLRYMELLKEHDLIPEVVCVDETVELALHEESFQRICMNLIINTVHYGEAPFRISIRQEKETVMILFENKVKTGMSVDTEHMFDRFYKGSDARTQKGSGLGLAIVKELVLRMHGEVSSTCSHGMLNIMIKVSGQKNKNGEM